MIQEHETLLTTVQYLKDRQDVLDCIVRESRGRDRHDETMIASCYWEDGTNERGSAITPASEFPAAANRGHSAGFAATSHNITNHSCELSGDSAYCESYVIGGLLSVDQTTCKIVGSRYIDHLERRRGEWRILRRRTIIDLVSEGHAKWLREPPLAGFLRGVRSKDDPSYRRDVASSLAEARW
jgi:SnoaL-like protein